ncbi:MAG: cyclic nucleotide-binding domain-containing protein [Rhodospirillaceae bacterium]|nr:cyclic nucleotide-binding domain-containing protein [Rhodospirillaceae bacterium]
MADQTDFGIIRQFDPIIPSFTMNTLPGRTRIFSDQDFLLRAGEDPDAGFVIITGRVELRNAAGTLLGDARQGDVIGAASLLFGGRQDLSAIAAGPVEAAMVDRGTVAAELSRNPDLVRSSATQLLKALNLVPAAETGAKQQAEPCGAFDFDTDSNVVPITGKRAPAAAHPGDIAEMGSWSAIWLKPASDATRSGMPKRGIKINETPYGVGRKPKRGEQIPRTDIILQFSDERPYNLSRHHFMIELGRPGLMIRDAGSQLGTLVNGERIGLDEPRNAVSLHIGENAIEAGGYDTPFHFIIVILA